jgi:hypothetical protein
MPECSSPFFGTMIFIPIASNSKIQLEENTALTYSS